MVRFILNDQLQQTELLTGSTVLDYVRYHKRLVGTKIGCREGDCGACTVLVGDLENGKLVYRSMTSCLMPLGNAAGKHIVTVEGINMKSLSPVQQSMVDANGTQCGFCTIGFVMSLTGLVLDETKKGYDEGIVAIDGNICRCTGYKSIERSVELLTQQLADKPSDGHLQWLVDNHFIPEYFTGIRERLLELKKTRVKEESSAAQRLVVGGGTDLVVQKHALVKKSSICHLIDDPQLKGIRQAEGQVHLGASVTVTEFAESDIVREIFPNLKKHVKLVSSSPIRNMATLAGNLVNASPIGDMTVFLLALDASIVLNNGQTGRTISLKDFYTGYKQTVKTPDEYIEAILFTAPRKDTTFSFEKVCKRTHLDIASVNCACSVDLDEEGIIKKIHLAAGGIAPYPKYLSQTVSFLKGRKLEVSVLKEAITIMNSEIAPISDVRGTKEYKQLLLRQLFLAHFKSHEMMIQKVVQTS